MCSSDDVSIHLVLLYSEEQDVPSDVAAEEEAENWREIFTAEHQVSFGSKVVSPIISDMGYDSVMNPPPLAWVRNHMYQHWCTVKSKPANTTCMSSRLPW